MNYHIRSGSWLEKVAYFTAKHLGYPKAIIENLELPTSKTEVSVAFIGCSFRKPPCGSKSTSDTKITSASK